jgi:hypothetical protein
MTGMNSQSPKAVARGGAVDTGLAGADLRAIADERQFEVRELVAKDGHR